MKKSSFDKAITFNQSSCKNSYLNNNPSSHGKTKHNELIFNTPPPLFNPKNLKISPNNLKFFNQINKTNSNLGFLTNSHFINKKKKKFFKKETDKFAALINNSSLIGNNQNSIDNSINVNLNENVNLFTNTFSINSKRNSNVNLMKINASDSIQNNINIRENNYLMNNNPNITNKDNNNNSSTNINSMNSPKKNSFSRKFERRYTQKSSNNKNELSSNNINSKDPLAISNEERDLLYKIGASPVYKDYNNEKNKFLETIYEKLNDKNTSHLKENTVDYCKRFLHYSTKDIEDITSK
jgi:hypothetical protein